jgi:arabinofuranan 3-O-arabinosyltransferase
VMPRAVRTGSLRITVVSAVAPAGATPAQRRAVGIGEVTGIGGLSPVAAPVRQRFQAPCGSARVDTGSAQIALRVSGSATAFATGTPLRAVSCGHGVRLAAGTQTLAVAPGAFAVDTLRLSAPAPMPAAPPSSPGRVLRSGVTGEGSVTGAHVAVTAPAWLVLGQGYDRGWRASCDGHSLGAPTPIDGYANGWPVAAGCRDVSFTFAPNRLAEIGYLISAVAGLVCLLLVLMLLAGRRVTRPAAVRSAWAAPAARRWAWGHSAAAAVPAAVAFGFVFGYGPGLIALPVIAAVLRWGVGARALTLAAGALLGVVVPVVYVVAPGPQSGGNHFGYAMSHLAAHYVGVAALGLLMVAVWRALSGVRR